MTHTRLSSGRLALVGAVFAAGILVAAIGLYAFSRSRREAPGAAIEREALEGLKMIYQRESSVMGERARYTDHIELLEIDQSTEWCPDAARLRDTRQVKPNESLGCHFLYGVELRSDALSYRAYARGVAAPALGLEYQVVPEYPIGEPRQACVMVGAVRWA